MDHPTPDWLALLRARTDTFADLVRDADLDAPVTHRPDWTVHDLVAHLGGVHEWAAHAVVAGDPDLSPEQPSATDSRELAEWYADRAAHLLDVLTRTPSDAPAWTLDRDDRTAGFWRRRQVHETAMHVWDLEEALGQPRPIDPWLAWDGVLEVVDVLHPRQVRLGRAQPPADAVRLIATDVSGDVTIGHGDPVVVRDRAEVLLRLLWHRADVTALDPRAAALLSAAVTP
ncbi:hypothetical protein ASG76_04770 [Nocardioides sp. Soil774]|uniref:maleylpyruvate isomerase family mycothiol-dependent enzyme n=1 Tax=Nocardioides sp. Soil774 TaxID=1736408 RepID=UPI0006F36A01|nr:maleylpyruvate isomerase family mycothiol-dependent enzyme [Nocardioides sp. Soil774]KRE96338.1 hypothetical protein ASG76_04770 [Nocardioides sp. Soil774]